MGKFRQVNGYIRATLDKLEGTRGNLVRTDDWQEWKFEQLVEALQKWTVMNLLKPNEGLNHKKPPSWKLPVKWLFLPKQKLELMFSSIEASDPCRRVFPPTSFPLFVPQHVLAFPSIFTGQ